MTDTILYGAHKNLKRKTEQDKKYNLKEITPKEYLKKFEHKENTNLQYLYYDYQTCLYLDFDNKDIVRFDIESHIKLVQQYLLETYHIESNQIYVQKNNSFTNKYHIYFQDVIFKNIISIKSFVLLFNEKYLSMFKPEYQFDPAVYKRQELFRCPFSYKNEDNYPYNPIYKKGVYNQFFIFSNGYLQPDEHYRDHFENYFIKSKQFIQDNVIELQEVKKKVEHRISKLNQFKQITPAILTENMSHEDFQKVIDYCNTIDCYSEGCSYDNRLKVIMIISRYKDFEYRLGKLVQKQLLYEQIGNLSVVDKAKELQASFDPDRDQITIGSLIYQMNNNREYE